MLHACMRVVVHLPTTLDFGRSIYLPSQLSGRLHAAHAACNRR